MNIILITINFQGYEEQSCNLMTMLWIHHANREIDSTYMRLHFP